MDFSYISEDPDTIEGVYDANVVNRITLLINSVHWKDIHQEQSEDSDVVVAKAKSITIHPRYDPTNEVSYKVPMYVCIACKYLPTNYCIFQ